MQIKLGERLKALRLKRELTQSELGELVGLDQRFIANVEAGRKLVSLETLILLADFFKCSLDYLVGREN